jgi:hypothetical protein
VGGTWHAKRWRGDPAVLKVIWNFFYFSVAIAILVYYCQAFRQILKSVSPAGAGADESSPDIVEESSCRAPADRGSQCYSQNALPRIVPSADGTPVSF